VPYIIRTFVRLALLSLSVWVVSPAAHAQVAGSCGAANGAELTRAPTQALCSVGTNSQVYGSGPWAWTCAANTVAHCSAQLSTAPDKPGPSAALFISPYYTCLRNFYVAQTGSDANPGTWSRPYRTIAQAQAVGLQAGDCVNVEPGTYTTGVWISSGGNKASSTGYVVYRCTTMDACTVTDVTAGGNGSFVWNNTRHPMTGSYVIIDGFVMSAATKNVLQGQGVGIATNWYTPSVHHVWILNSIISGYGQSGVQMNQGEYFYVVHNTIYGNAGTNCNAQGSGISFAALIAAPGYTATADDLDNPVLGDIGSSFHNAVEWNVLYNNAVTNCGTASRPVNTDGNNIIMDTLDWNQWYGAVPYTDGVLIAFNVTYNAGGAGIHLYNSDDITVANNTCFNNWLDPYDTSSARGCINSMSSHYANTIINNIAVALPAGHTTCTYTAPPYGRWNNAFLGSSAAPDVFSNNIAYMVGSGCYGEAPMWGDTFSCSANKCATSPGWVSVGDTSMGSETTPPVGVNFALQAGSPAIGYGLTKSYLPPSSVDVGACSSVFTSCP
jgi:parallel beta-helix repeat protein